LGSFDLRTISIYVVIALIVGAGAGYMIGNSPVSSLMEERDGLEAEYDSLYLALQSLEVELEEAEFNIIGLNRTILLLSDRYADMIFIDHENQVLQQQYIEIESEMSILAEDYQYVEDKYDELQVDCELLQEAFESLNQSYTDLLNSLNMTVVEGFSQTIEYNISAGTDRTWEFLIPEYGVIWEASINFNGWHVKHTHSWRRGDERYLVGRGSNSLITEGVDWIVYYGPREYLWGTLKLEYYLDDRYTNKIWAICTMRSQLPTIGGNWDAEIIDPMTFD